MNNSSEEDMRRFNEILADKSDLPSNIEELMKDFALKRHEKEMAYNNELSDFYQELIGKSLSELSKDGYNGLQEIMDKYDLSSEELHEVLDTDPEVADIDRDHPDGLSLFLIYNESEIIVDATYGEWYAMDND